MSSYLPFQRFHRREEENVADGRAVGEEHDETVDADADAARWGKAILKSNDIILVHDVRFGVPRFALLHLIDKALPLIEGIVELGKAIRQLAAVDEELEAIGKHGVIGIAFRQR